MVVDDEDADHGGPVGILTDSAANVGTAASPGVKARSLHRSAAVPLHCGAMPLPDVLRQLLTASGPSGYERAPAQVFADACSAFAEVETDVMGTVTARVKGTGDGPTVAIVGHIDEIGLIVTHIDDKGFLSFAGVGGWDPMILVGQRVEISTRGGVVPGVVGKKPIHLLSQDDRKKAPELKDLHIDIGAKDGDEAKGLVRLGDVAVVAGEPVELPNDRVASRAHDNRLGCYVAYEAARLIAEAGGAAGDVIAVAAVQEETVFGGSKTAAYALNPDVAIVVDVTHATDAPGIEERLHGTATFGSGPAIERGSILHPQVFELLHDAAEAESIPFTVAVSAGNTWTDADAFHLSRAGVPTGLLGIPLRYMHSPVELVQLDDVENTAKLCAAFARRLAADTVFRR
jgi:endoglucanase